MKNTNKHTEKLGLTTPVEYFDAFQNSILQKIEIEAITNTHNKIGLNTPLKYKEKATKQILETVSTKEVAVISLFKRNAKYIAFIAASVILILFLSINGFNVFNNSIKNSPSIVKIDDSNDDLLNSISYDKDLISDYGNTININDYSEDDSLVENIILDQL